MFLGILPSLRMVHGSFSSLLLAGTLNGVVTACVAPQRGWDMAVPLIVVVQVLGPFWWLPAAGRSAADGAI